jgi:hypothetical protein
LVIDPFYSEVTTAAPVDDDSDRPGDEPAAGGPSWLFRRRGTRWRLGALAAGIIGMLSLGAAGVLLVLDLTKDFLTSGAHSVLSAAPLALIAIAYLTHQSLRRLTLLRGLKVALLAAAFLLWSAYQLFPSVPYGPVLNDLAITLFVLDMALIVSGRPQDSDLV